jgi:hypothetical protein
MTPMQQIQILRSKSEWDYLIYIICYLLSLSLSLAEDCPDPGTSPHLNKIEPAGALYYGSAT